MLSAVLAPACASDTHWDRPCAGAEDLEREREACLEQLGHDGVMDLTTSRALERCLKQRGWERLPIGQSASCPAETAPAGAAAEPGPEPGAPADPRRDFDACFARCRELTDRTKEGCFDACLGR